MRFKLSDDKACSPKNCMAYWVVTDRQTDRITIANTRSAVPASTAVMCKMMFHGHHWTQLWLPHNAFKCSQQWEMAHLHFWACCMVQFCCTAVLTLCTIGTSSLVGDRVSLASKLASGFEHCWYIHSTSCTTAPTRVEAHSGNCAQRP